MAFGTFGKVEDRREHPRSKVSLPGRLLLADRREYACTIIDVSMGGIGILARERGAIGEMVVIYAGDYGRIEGRVARHFNGGFGIKLTGASRAAEALTRRFEAA